MEAQRTFGEFYVRQTVLPELGEEGQRKLRASKVGVVGLGGVGSAAALYLALAGVGMLRLIDMDTVEVHNLHRQVLYSTADVRRPKVEAAARRISEVNPDVKVEAIADNLRGSNAHELLSDLDCVVDGLDNMATRYVVNRECAIEGMPYVFGGAIGMEGNVSVFRAHKTPCLECLFPGVDDGWLPTCETRGVLGVTTGIIGSLEAAEAIKLLAGIGSGLEGRLLVLDLSSLDISIVELTTREDCPVLRIKGHEEARAEEKVAWLCGSNTININPPARMQVDLEEAHQKLKGSYEVILRTPMVLVLRYEGYEVSLFRNGRMLVKALGPRLAARDLEKEALRVYKSLTERITALAPST